MEAAGRLAAEVLEKAGKLVKARLRGIADNLSPEMLCRSPELWVEPP